MHRTHDHWVRRARGCAFCFSAAKHPQMYDCSEASSPVAPLASTFTRERLDRIALQMSELDQGAPMVTSMPRGRISHRLFSLLIIHCALAVNGYGVRHTYFYAALTRREAMFCLLAWYASCTPLLKTSAHRSTPLNLRTSSSRLRASLEPRVVYRTDGNSEPPHRWG